MLKSKLNRLGHLAAAGFMSMGLSACESEAPQLPESVEIPAVQVKSALTSSADPDCAAALGIRATGPSLVMNDSAVLADRFALRDTLQNIIETGGLDGSPETLMASMLEDMDDPNQINLLSGFPMPTDVRMGEANMVPATVVDGMQASALFNRLDLAPADGSNCGEYRVAYGKSASESGMPAGSLHIIFEAKYPNPSPELGLDGCRPIGELWASLENPSLSDAQRADVLQAFYYDGLSPDSAVLPAGFDLKVALPPVITWDNYRESMGQVRTNNFIEFEKWQLREHRTGVAGDSAVFVADTIKGNALAELFGTGSSPSPSHGAEFESMRVDFQANFISDQMNLLMGPEINGAQTATDVITSFGLATPPEFDEFQSDAQGLADDPKQHAMGTAFQAEIDAAIPPETGLTASHILNRAGAMTCGGCHRFSRDREIAPSEDLNLNGLLDEGEDRDGDGILDDAVLFPRDAGFVHVTAGGGLSAALINHFLPVRKRLLESFLCEPAVVESGLDDDDAVDSEDVFSAAQETCKGRPEGEACTLVFDGIEFEGQCSTLFGPIECVDNETLVFFFGPDQLSDEGNPDDDFVPDTQEPIVEPVDESCDGEHHGDDDAAHVAPDGEHHDGDEFIEPDHHEFGPEGGIEDEMPETTVEGSRYEMGRAYIESSVDSNWTYVPFMYPFAQVPAVFIIPDATGYDPCHTRVRNITAEGFEATCVEPEGEDGPHSAMDVAYIAAIEGDHELGSRQVQVSCVDVSEVQHNVSSPISTAWARVEFAQTFYKTPVLLAQIQSDNNEVLGDKASDRGLNPWLTTAVKAVSPNGFRVALELSEVEPADYIAPERVCYAAYEHGVTEVDGPGLTCQFTSIADVRSRDGDANGCHGVRLDERLGYTPLAVGFKTTRNGNNGGWTRSCESEEGSVSFYIEEDRATDPEQKHISERVDVVACSDVFSF